MTNEDIKKALEICVDDYHSCDGCPYDDVRNCSDTLRIDARTLIIEQEREITQLKDGYARVQELFAQYQMASDKEIKAQRRQAQIDVLNKVKSLAIYDDNYLDGYIFVDDIDKLIAEVENDRT